MAVARQILTLCYSGRRDGEMAASNAPSEEQLAEAARPTP
jgi:hypothetical protein